MRDKASIPCDCTDVPREAYLDPSLYDLLDLISGTGRWGWMGGAGFHTYPGMDDNQQGLHDSCVELERRGMIHRHIEQPGHVVWKRTEGKPA